MCKDRKISFSLLPRRCSACSSPIEHWFWYKNGARNHLKQKYICSSCGLIFLPTSGNELDKGLEDRFQFANLLFEETKIMNLLEKVPSEDIYFLSENEEVIKVTNDGFYDNFLVEEMELYVSKNDIFSAKERIKIFVPYWNYKELYIPKKYLIQ